MPTKPKKILNDPSNSVKEFIEGLLLQYPNHMQKLENHDVLLWADRSSEKVQLISGGGSGHEPSHAGWLGMLSAAVCGGIFASPSVASILATIRALEGNCLLVVKNYTGDRLNFGLATEQACQEGLNCEMVVVADDCALPRTKGITGARGVAGTVLVRKIASAAAAVGRSLPETANLARLVNANMGTLGIALNTVTVPGAEHVNERLAEGQIEIGLGIHGEAGLRQSPLLTADEMAMEMISSIQNYGRLDKDGQVRPMFQKGDPVCLLVNNLGGTSNFEMSVLANACVKLLESEKFGAKATRVLVGSYMTSFDMHGASLTILNCGEHPEFVEYLDMPTSAPAWSFCDAWQDLSTPRPSTAYVKEVKKVQSSVESTTFTPPASLPDFSSLARKCAETAATQLSEAEPMLTQYDTIVGDGDCGITMKRGASEVLGRLGSGAIPTDHPTPMFAALAQAVSESMGGTSGVLLELMFRKMASACHTESVTATTLAEAVQAGVNAVSLYGGAHVGSRTMLDALVPAARALVDSVNVAEAAAKARQGADSTAAMKSASAGRSNYLSQDTLDGTPDPGAVAAAIVFEAVAKVLA